MYLLPCKTNFIYDKQPSNDGVFLFDMMIL
jgi:hypothetical protein